MNDLFVKEAEKLFIHDYQELNILISEGGQRSLIKASAILRRFYLDDSPLIHLANKLERLKITYKIGESALFLQKRSIKIDGVDYEALASFQFIDATEPHSREVNLNTFLSTPTASINIGPEMKTFTVREIIKLCANILGGVHYSKPKSSDDEWLYLLTKMAHYKADLSVVVHHIKRIAIVVVNALEPLNSRILEKQDKETS